MSRLGWTMSMLGIAGSAVAHIDWTQTLARGAPRRTLLAPDLVAAGLADIGISERAYLVLGGLRVGAVVALLFAVALIIIWKAPEARAAGMFALVLSGFGAVLLLDVLGPTAGPGRLGLVLGTVAFTAFFFSFYLFPDGRFVPRWTLWLMPFWVMAALAAAFPGSVIDGETWNPVAAAILWAVLFLSCPVAVGIRFRRHADTLQRQQIKWVAFGVGVMVATYLLFWLGAAFVPALQSNPAAAASFDVFGGSVLVASYGAVPVAVAMAMLRRRLWDIEPIMGRTLVYAVLTVAVVGIYVGIVGYLGTVLQLEESLAVSLVATAVVAVAFQPLRQVLQRTVNHLLYGQRHEPYEAIARLGRSLEMSASPEAVLPRVVETLRDSLRLPHASVLLEENGASVVVASSGSPGGDVHDIPLTFGAGAVGTLRVAPRAPGSRFTKAESRLLDDLARQVGVVAHAYKLATELQRAREGLIRAREEERRRLSHELHDGLGPLLASQTLTIASAQRSITSDPPGASRLLDQARDHGQSAIEDIRRIVRGLRPPTLDSLGLRGALRSLATEFSGTDLRVMVSVPEALPEMPAATEVACYRIAQEALTNTVRHARATACEVRLGVVDGSLNLLVADDGCGMPRSISAGVGLASMRQRAEESGGSFDVTSSESGTAIRVTLPMGHAP